MGKALVLAGGGAKADFQVGVLCQLHERGWFPDVVFGTSGGGVNGGGMAFGGPLVLKEIWTGIRSWRDVFAVNWGTLIGFSDGILNTKPLRRLLAQNMKGKSPRCEVEVTSVQLSSGRLVFTRVSDPDFLSAVEAGAAIPGLISPVNGFSDGGIRNRCPLKRAIEKGSDEIVVVLCDPWNNGNPEPWKRSSRFLESVEIGLRAVDLALHEILIDDIQETLSKNFVAGYKNLKITVYAPETAIHGTMDFDAASIRAGIMAGLGARPLDLSHLVSTFYNVFPA